MTVISIAKAENIELFKYLLLEKSINDIKINNVIVVAQNELTFTPQNNSPNNKTKHKKMKILDPINPLKLVLTGFDLIFFQ